MTWTTTSDPDEFSAAAGAFVRSRPIEHTLLLTIVDRLRRQGPTAFGGAPPLLGWWDAGTGPSGAFLVTPPHPAWVTDVPAPAAAALADLLLEVLPDVTGLGGAPATVETFGTRWRARTGRAGHLAYPSRLYRLDDLVPPDPAPPGAARVATAADRDVLRAWLVAFSVEGGVPDAGIAAQIEDRLEYGGYLLWEVDGRPVALAGRTRVFDDMARVAPVYTPPELRGRGYGSAVTAAVSRAARDAGATDVVLFTDLDNPVSNAIYQRLGYRPVEDRAVLLLTDTDKDGSS